MKKINEQKLQAFTTGAMGKRTLSRKELEEQRKREEEAAAADVFKEFVETFQEAPSKISKVWVKAGTYDAGSRKEDHRDKGKLYKPQSKLDDSTDKSLEYVKMLANENRKESSSAIKKKNQEKKKSNLELFKEELRQIQEEREERHKYKHIARSMLPASASTTVEPDPVFKDVEMGSFDNGDPNTTNLYLGNLNPKISEQQLMELFGKFGPLASIKIMWPRSEEEKSRGRNCGFVAYMSRKDAERALKALNGKDIMNYEMKLGWGKSVPILTHPIYVPPALAQFALPPPPSGLPFNAQPHPNDVDNIPKMTSKMYMNDEDIQRRMDDILYKSIIKVVIPTERALVMLIHRTIEFVIREGPMFEALIMTREIDNPMYKFLFENESPSHIYYRWKLFSLLQGDTPTEWRMSEFRMFKGGSIWKPPPVNFYTQGMPEDLINEDHAEPNKGALSVAQRDRLEDLLRHLTPERQKIGDAMIFCIEHADAADEICECISEALSSNETLVRKKIARIYLVSDILHNCSVKVQNASFYRKSMEKNLLDMFKSLNSYYMALDSRLKAEGFRARVMQILKAWEEWTVYPKDFLLKLKNTFLGLPVQPEKQEEDFDEEKEDEDLDGVPLDGAALLKGAMLRGISDSNSRTPVLHDNSSDNDDDIDGMPIEEDIDGIPFDPADYPKSHSGSFIPSKWETVDANQIEAQAVTTSKWEQLDPPAAPEPPKIKLVASDSSEEYVDNNRDFDEERRLRLREIEVKLMQYQDEIESGQKGIKPGWSISEQLEHYRKKLIRKSEQEMKQPPPDSDSASEMYAQSSSSSKKSIKKSLSPVEIPSPKRYKKHKKSKRSSSSEYASPVRTSKTSRRSRSPHVKSSKSSKRKASRSRSVSDSPKRYVLAKSPPPRSSKYDLSPVRSSKYDISPVRSSKYDLSPVRTSKYDVSPVVRSSKYETSPVRSSKYDASPPSRSSKYDKYDTSKYETSSKYDTAKYESKYDTNLKYDSNAKYEMVAKYESSPRKYRSPSPKARNVSPPPSSSRSGRSRKESSPSSYRYHRETSCRSEKHKKHKYS